MDTAGVKQGAAVVLDIETGGIRALVSRPTFNPNALGESLQQTDAPLINRALLGSPVGSVFKPIIAAAALEQGLPAETAFLCTGTITVNGQVFRCHKEDGHGTVAMKEAVAKSCNPYFIQLVQQLDLELLLGMVQAAGYGRSTELAEGITAAAGYAPTLQDLNSPAAIANYSFGQGSLLATPLQLAACFAAIADGGQYRRPYLVESLMDKQQQPYQSSKPATAERIMLASTAKQVRSFLIETVETGSGKAAKPGQGGAGGKTATAQTGSFQGEAEQDNVWFAGFFPAENPKYALAILMEGGVSGAADCAPIFKEIADRVNALPQ